MGKSCGVPAWIGGIGGYSRKHLKTRLRSAHSIPEPGMSPAVESIIVARSSFFTGL